jgi:dephospho-CoA kinase
MKVIGLTGGIGSGKSTVSEFVKELGAVVVEADKIGHDVFKPGSKAWRQVVQEFGDEIVGEGGEINRARLGEIVFNNPRAMTRLNEIMHPAIFSVLDERVEECRKKGVGVVVLEIPLLIETGRTAGIDEIWVTVAPEATVIKRLRKRNQLSKAEVKARIHSQLTNEERIKRADAVINTDCSLEDVKERVKELWKKLQ